MIPFHQDNIITIIKKLLLYKKLINLKGCLRSNEIGYCFTSSIPAQNQAIHFPYKIKEECYLGLKTDDVY